MAKIEEQIIAFKFSRLVKDTNSNKSESDNFLNKDLLKNLEQVAQELLGDNIVVELISD